ncbi:hypothetical protein EVAR_44942_1 [Eumeta japonica]|uniref:Uncharacterized protein n=1 Tax=Eumeta variegata TaxID=151549 RepID=A0A4C1W6C7_EUMVA|nr:hypothetical protein EVAR_44942_1 [Eumeta japonica]
MKYTFDKKPLAHNINYRIVIWVTGQVINPERFLRPPESPFEVAVRAINFVTSYAEVSTKKTPIGQSRVDGITMPKWPRFRMKES